MLLYLIMSSTLVLYVYIKCLTNKVGLDWSWIYEKRKMLMFCSLSFCSSVELICLTTARLLLLARQLTVREWLTFTRFLMAALGESVCQHWKSWHTPKWHIWFVFHWLCKIKLLMRGYLNSDRSLCLHRSQSAKNDSMSQMSGTRESLLFRIINSWLVLSLLQVSVQISFQM